MKKLADISLFENLCKSSCKHQSHISNDVSVFNNLDLLEEKIGGLDFFDLVKTKDTPEEVVYSIRFKDPSDYRRFKDAYKDIEIVKMAHYNNPNWYTRHTSGGYYAGFWSLRDGTYERYAKCFDDNGIFDAVICRQAGDGDYYVWFKLPIQEYGIIGGAERVDGATSANEAIEMLEPKYTPADPDSGYYGKRPENEYAKYAGNLRYQLNTLEARLKETMTVAEQYREFLAKRDKQTQGKLRKAIKKSNETNVTISTPYDSSDYMDVPNPGFDASFID